MSNDLPVIPVADLAVPLTNIWTIDLLTIADPLSIIEAYHRCALQQLLAEGPSPEALEDKHVEWLAYWTTCLTTRLDLVLATLARDTPYLP